MIFVQNISDVTAWIYRFLYTPVCRNVCDVFLCVLNFQLIPCLLGDIYKVYDTTVLEKASNIYTPLEYNLYKGDSHLGDTIQVLGPLTRLS